MWTSRLAPEQARKVTALALRAGEADGVDPLNEDAWLALRDSSAEHLIELSGSLAIGYLQWQPGNQTAQLVVDPGYRRRGIGRALLNELSARQVTWAVWAFGNLKPAQALCASAGLVPVRTLLLMSRERFDSPTPKVVPGLTLRSFTNADRADLIAVNAAAFAHHREQGQLDEAGFAARAEQDWFDPDGLILGFDAEGLAGFHWTKMHPDQTGEVYVLAVAPRAQGRGYGAALLQAGLEHLHASGANRVILYVDIADQVAVRMYGSAGFTVTSRDVCYAPQGQERR